MTTFSECTQYQVKDLVLYGRELRAGKSPRGK